MPRVTMAFSKIASAVCIIHVVAPDAAPIKRIVQDAREKGALIDASCGRRTRAVIVMDSDHVILSAVQPETIAGRSDAEAGPAD